MVSVVPGHVLAYANHLQPRKGLDAVWVRACEGTVFISFFMNWFNPESGLSFRSHQSPLDRSGIKPRIHFSSSEEHIAWIQVVHFLVFDSISRSMDISAGKRVLDTAILFWWRIWVAWHDSCQAPHSLDLLSYFIYICNQTWSGPSLD